MSAQWKPGQVLANETNEPMFVIEVTGNTIAAAKTGQAWVEGSCVVTPDGNGWRPDVFSTLRPLVVIDAEDDEAVERLRKALSDSGAFTGLTKGNVSNLQAALREFATPTPPKPDEPQGLGARVTDHGGLEWAARTGLHPAPDGMGLIERRWGCLNGSASDRTWDELFDTRGPLDVEVQP